MAQHVVDLSQFNGTVDWTAVQKGVSGAILRAGYRGYGAAGTLVKDSRLTVNLRGAQQAGVPKGAYFTTQAITRQEAQAEADFVWRCLSGYTIELPVFWDSERSGSAQGSRADHLSAQERTDYAIAFCERVRDHGYTPGIYASLSWLEQELEPARLGSYCIWVADYAVSPPTGLRYDAWQYTDRGTLAGVVGDVDLSWFDLNAEEGSDLKEDQVRQIVYEILRGENTQVSGALAAEWEQAKALGITDGTRPGGYATRAQAAVMALRARGEQSDGSE